MIILSVILFIGVISAISFFLKNNVEQTNLRDETKNQVEIITDYINIRESQDVSSDILGKVYRGEIYTILSENIDSKYKWLEIETSNGIKGNISGVEDYVKRLYIENNEGQTEEPNENNEGQTNINDNKETNNNQNNTKPNTSNDNKTNNNTDNTTNKDNNDDYEPQLKACLKTCDEGYILKNENSVDCYCEKIPVEKTAKEKLIDVMKQKGYSCTSVQCTKNINDYGGLANTLVYSETFAINFTYRKISWVYAYYNGSGRGKVEIYYDTNTGTSDYYGAGINPDYYQAICSQIFPTPSCTAPSNAPKKIINETLSKFNSLLSEANITIEDLKSSN